MSFLDVNVDTLTYDDIKLAAVRFTVTLFAIGGIGLYFYRSDNKKLAWTLSAVNSFAMSVAGVYYLYQKVPQYDNFFFLGNNGRTPWYGSSNFCTLINLWFALANIFDLVFGTVFYPKYMGLLTGYIHHSVFIWIMLTSATGNGLFIQTAKFAPAFSLMLIEEIPTFLLALGSIFSAFRSDLGFGATFFLFRICYHSYGFFYAFRSGADAPLLGMYSMTLALHLFWFYGWFSKYSGLFQKGEKKKNK
jgi:hypothetical protein